MKQANRSYTASAPGSIMLMGEHAVLRNKLAIVGAVDKRITVTLTPYNNRNIDIYSALSEHHTTLDTLEDNSQLRFVIAALQHYQTSLNHGFRLEIHSEFSSTVGLGSSAAVVVATLACLSTLRDDKTTQQQLFLDAREIIQHVQGRGSGADVAASVFGGVVAYRMSPFFIEKSDHLFDIALIYTGYKTPTSEVIQLVDQHIKSNPNKYEALFSTMNNHSEDAWQAIQRKNWRLLGKSMAQHQQAQHQLGVCDKKSAELIMLLNQDPHVLACKISGSGLGDCLVALTTPDFEWKYANLIDATLSAQGVTCESK